MVLRGGTEEMASGQLSDFLHPEGHPDWVDRYRVQQQFRGTRESLRRTRAAIAVAPHQDAQLRKIGATDRPVLIVWGRQDRAAPFAASRALLAAMPRATFLPVDSAAHLPHIEQPGLVRAAVLEFLRAPPDSVRGRTAGRRQPAAAGLSQRWRAIHTSRETVIPSGKCAAKASRSPAACVSR